MPFADLPQTLSTWAAANRRQWASTLFYTATNVLAIAPLVALYDATSRVWQTQSGPVSAMLWVGWCLIGMTALFGVAALAFARRSTPDWVWITTGVALILSATVSFNAIGWLIRSSGLMYLIGWVATRKEWINR